MSVSIIWLSMCNQCVDDRAMHHHRCPTYFGLYTANNLTKKGSTTSTLGNKMDNIDTQRFDNNISKRICHYV